MPPSQATAFEVRHTTTLQVHEHYAGAGEAFTTFAGGDEVFAGDQGAGDEFIARCLIDAGATRDTPVLVAESAVRAALEARGEPVAARPTAALATRLAPVATAANVTLAVRTPS